MRSASRSAVCALLLSATFFSPVAHAQSQDQAAARALFDQGRRLMKQGQYENACSKLDAANRLYSSAGILLNLADCYEKVGRTASAWSEFGQAASAASHRNRSDQASEAARRQAALESKLVRLTVSVRHEVSGLSIRRDGIDLAPAGWGTPIPVDPGTHEVRAEAPGHAAWTTSVSVTTPGQTLSIEVPELSATPAPVEPAATSTGGGAPELVAPTQPVAESAPADKSSSTLDWVLVGGGAALGLGGGLLMLVESGRASTARKDGDTAEYDSAKTPYYVGVTGLAVGAVSAATGLALLAMSHEHQRTGTRDPIRATVWFDAKSSGLRIGGGW